MANHRAVYGFAESLLAFLRQSHAIFSPALPATKFEVLSSSRFSSPDETIDDATISLYLHRLTINNSLRKTRNGPPVGPLGLDLHFLLTVWSSSHETELVLMGWAMRQLHFHAFLDASSLSVDANWEVDEVISLFAAEITTEEMARIWESSRRGYRLSYPFIARIVRLGIDQSPPGEPVVAARFTFSDNAQSTEP